MGKKARSRQDKSVSSLECKQSTSEISPLIQDTLSQGSNHSKFDTSSIILELQEAIICIYKEFLDDLKIRKHRRLELKIPTQDTHHYNLIVNSTYQILLKSKVSELLAHSYRCSLEIIIDETLEYFIDKLRRFIEEADEKSRLLQVVYIHEAYHSLKNAISQISSIFIEVYPEDEFIKVTVKKFYENVLIRHKKILKFAKTQDFTHYAISFIVKLYDSVEKCMQSGTYNSISVLLDIETSAEGTSEPVHSLPLDDVLKYINGTSHKRGEKWGNQKNMTLLDKEISEFENRLATTKPAIQKPIPLCSLEFLKSLTDRYHQIRRNLLSN